MSNKLTCTISFDDSLVPNVIGAFGNKMDKEKYLVDKNSAQRVLSPDGDYIHISEFAGITKGSRVYIKSDIPSLIDFVDKRK